MPTEIKFRNTENTLPVTPHNLNSSESGRDYAYTLVQHFEDVIAREQAQQLSLNATDQRIDELWDIGREERALPEELLEVLTNALKRYDKEFGGMGYVGVDGRDLKTIRATIAKATQ